MPSPDESGLTKITINLTPRGQAALDLLCAGGDNKTDAINRALRVAALVEQVAPGDQLVVKRVDGTHERIWIP